MFRILHSAVDLAIAQIEVKAFGERWIFGGMKEKANPNIRHKEMGMKQVKSIQKYLQEQPSSSSICSCVAAAACVALAGHLRKTSSACSLWNTGEQARQKLI